MGSKLEIVALPEELLRWTAEAITGLGLHAAATWLFPESSKLAAPTDLLSAKERPPEWIVLDLAPIDLGPQNPVTVFSESRRGVIIHLGTHNEEGLRISQIDAMRPGRPSGWAKQFLAVIRTKSTAGLWAIGPFGGGSVHLDKVRITDGARDLAASGGKLLAFAGGTQFVTSNPRRQVTGTWRAISESEFQRLFDAQYAGMEPLERELFERFRVTLRRATIKRSESMGDEAVFVVAMTEGAVLYFDDVEYGFNLSDVDSEGRILHPGGSQSTLRQAVTTWFPDQRPAPLSEQRPWVTRKRNTKR